jgi:hypothetical protein
LAIIIVSIKPLAPTSEPATINTLFNKISPAKAAAIPEKELSKDITTGMSPPPIGRTNPIPPRRTRTNKTIKNSNEGTKNGVIKIEYKRNDIDI